MVKGITTVVGKINLISQKDYNIYITVREN